MWALFTRYCPEFCENKIGGGIRSHELCHSRSFCIKRKKLSFFFNLTPICIIIKHCVLSQILYKKNGIFLTRDLNHWPITWTITSAQKLLNKTWEIKLYKMVSWPLDPRVDPQKPSYGGWWWSHVHCRSFQPRRTSDGGCDCSKDVSSSSIRRQGSENVGKVTFTMLPERLLTVTRQSVPL